MLEKASGIVPDQEECDEERQIGQKSDKPALLKYGFVWGRLVNVAHNFTLQRFHTIPQPMSFVNG